MTPTDIEMNFLANYGDCLLLIGRCCLAVVFAASASSKFRRAPAEVQVVANLHIPAPAAVLVLVGIFEALGVIALVFGIYARIAAVLLMAFMLVISFAVLSFWSSTDPSPVRSQKFSAFTANIAIVGGLIYLLAAGPGQYSLLH